MRESKNGVRDGKNGERESETSAERQQTACESQRTPFERQGTGFLGEKSASLWEETAFESHGLVSQRPKAAANFPLFHEMGERVRERRRVRVKAGAIVV